jgi:hypothetical protein
MFCVATKGKPKTYLADTGSLLQLRWVEDKRGAHVFATEEEAYRRALFFDIRTDYIMVEPFKGD